VLGGQHEGRRLDEGARTGSVRGVVENDALADGFSHAEGHEPHRSSIVPLLDRDCAAGDDRHEVPGRSLVEEQLVGEAMSDAVDRIARACWSILEQMPPDMAGDLIDAGIMLTGGGALVPGLAGELSVRTNLPTTVANDPFLCVARGAGEILASPGFLERLRPQADRLTRVYQSLRIGMKEGYSR